MILDYLYTSSNEKTSSVIPQSSLGLLVIFLLYITLASYGQTDWYTGTQNVDRIERSVVASGAGDHL